MRERFTRLYVALHNALLSLKRCLYGSDNNLYERANSRSSDPTESPVTTCAIAETRREFPESLDDAVRVYKARGIIEQIETSVTDEFTFDLPEMLIDNYGREEAIRIARRILDEVSKVSSV